MELPNLRTDFGRRAYSYRGPNTWNQYRNDLRNLTDKNKFKKEVLKEIVGDENDPR